MPARSRSSEQEIDDPAASNMKPRAKVMQDSFIAAAGFLECIRENRHARVVERLARLLVDRFRQLHETAVIPLRPGWIEGDGGRQGAMLALVEAGE